MKIIGIFVCMLFIGTALTSVGMINIKKINGICNSQKSRIVWTRTYGGTSFDFLNSIIPTQDGGYLLGGKTYSWSNGIGDVWLIKTDNNGYELWNTSFGGYGMEGGPDDLIELDDGSFIIPTITESFGAGYFDIWLIKVDKNGNMIWNKTYGGEGADAIGSFLKIEEYYYFNGVTSSYGAGSFDAWLLKIDSEGNEIWNKTYGGPGEEWSYSMVPTDDGGFILCGEKYVPNEISWIFKIDIDGNMIWEKTYEPKIGNGYAFRIIQTNDDGYMVLTDTNFLYLGNIWLGKCDIGLIKTDNQGNINWEKTLGGFIFEDQCYSILQTNDNGYVITGFTKGFGGFIYQSTQYPPYKQACIIKTDVNGNIEWEENIGNGICFKAVEINDSIFALAGIGKPNRSWDGVLIKLN